MSNYKDNNIELQKITDNINLLAEFCGKRDIEELTKEKLEEKYGIACADVLILFGGTILEGCDVAANAMLN